jgi:hypothetical protein
MLQTGKIQDMVHHQGKKRKKIFKGGQSDQNCAQRKTKLRIRYKSS